METSVLLASAIIAAWLASTAFSLFYFELDGWNWLWAPLLIAFISWLNVGLFITAHDCMHGCFAPGYPRLTRFFGRLCMALYAGFSYDKFLPDHHGHHAAPGTATDPDFSASHPRQFWPWFWQFLRHYMGWRELVPLTTIVLLLWIMAVPIDNLLFLWALPAILSSLQLFTFGTYLPHRHREDAFADTHNARTNDYPEWLSLLTCFHFGYHHEHHLSPHLCWWQLPAARRARKAQ